jgi:hypothetical protein
MTVIRTVVATREIIIATVTTVAAGVCMIGIGIGTLMDATVVTGVTDVAHRQVLVADDTRPTTGVAEVILEVRLVEVAPPEAPDGIMRLQPQLPPRVIQMLGGEHMRHRALLKIKSMEVIRVCQRSSARFQFKFCKIFVILFVKKASSLDSSSNSTEKFKLSSSLTLSVSTFKSLFL